MRDVPAWVQYVSALAPALLFVSAVAAAGVAAFTLRHRRSQDRKDEWWRRTQWAIDRALADDSATQAVGLNMLALQANSSLADAEDGLVVDAVVDDVLQRIASTAGEPGVHYDVETRRKEGED